jgi:hypothetical protein
MPKKNNVNEAARVAFSNGTNKRRSPAPKSIQTTPIAVDHEQAMKQWLLG